MVDAASEEGSSGCDAKVFGSAGLCAVSCRGVAAACCVLEEMFGCVLTCVTGGDS